MADDGWNVGTSLPTRSAWRGFVASGGGVTDGVLRSSTAGCLARQRHRHGHLEGVRKRYLWDIQKIQYILYI